MHRPDLAAIVLADTERAATGPANRRWAGQDPRSVLILAIVVATLAMVVTWTATIGGADEQLPAKVPERTASATPDASVAPAPAASKTTAAAVVGTDIAPGSVRVIRAATGGMLAKVALRNVGDEPLAGSTGAQLLVLVDGERAGTSQLGEVAANGTTTVDVPLYSCSSGRHYLVVIADSTGRATEANERNNATARSVNFTC